VELEFLGLVAILVSREFECLHIVIHGNAHALNASAQLIDHGLRDSVLALARSVVLVEVVVGAHVKPADQPALPVIAPRAP